MERIAEREGKAGILSETQSAPLCGVLSRIWLAFQPYLPSRSHGDSSYVLSDIACRDQSALCGQEVPSSTFVHLLPFYAVSHLIVTLKTAIKHPLLTVTCPLRTIPLEPADSMDKTDKSVGASASCPSSPRAGAQRNPQVRSGFATYQ